MSDAFWASLPGTLISLGTLISTLVGLRRLEKVHKATNSMHDEIVRTARGEAFGEGQQAERDRPSTAAP